jgi:flagellar biosynthesis/type III secretory pathway chaperone
MVLFTGSALAFTPTQEQLEQLKKLPKAEQQALAKQYGIDISSLNNVTDKSQSTQSLDNTVQARAIDSENEQEQKDRFDPTEEALKPFGYELFSGEPTSFMPTEVASVPGDYIIDIGD